MRRKDISGQKFGRVTVISYSHTNEDKKACWNSVCDCGKKFVVSGKNLRNGNTKSCGCYAVEVTIKNSTTHGECIGGKTPEYYIWIAMKDRCLNSNNKSYKRYGGRGITVCDKWKNSYAAFLKDMGNKPTPNHSIERVDNFKGYSPDNCIWATDKQQMNNTRVNRILTYKGESLTVAQWSDKLGIKQVTLNMRLFRGWDVKRTLTTK